MKSYALVLFDIDGTLFDFDKSEEYALSTTLKEYGVEPTEQVISTYKEINNKWWKLFEQGKVEKSQISPGRFIEFWKEMGKEIDPEESGSTYTAHLSESVFVLPGAHEVCKEVSKRAKTAIVTNGIASVQYPRIAASGIEPYIGNIIVSEVVGAAKPDQRYFAAALDICGHATTHDVLIIGDSLYADIKGGNDFGIDTCWYNPNGLCNDSGVFPTYTISALEQLLDIVK